MLKNEVTESSTSPYVFNIIIVKKKNKADERIDRIYIVTRL